MSSDNRLTWDSFSVRKAAEEAGEGPESQPKRNKRPETTLSSILMQAIATANARRGRLSRAERIRQQTLLEILTESMRR